MIIAGVRLFGKVDENRSGYVVTRFFHIWFLPLVPVGSYFVVGEGAQKIPLSLRSVIAAYGRGFGAWLAIGCGLGFLYLLLFGFIADVQVYMRGGTAVTESEIIESVVFLAILGLAAVGGIVLFLLMRVLRKANAARCTELTRALGRQIAPL